MHGRRLVVRAERGELHVPVGVGGRGRGRRHAARFRREEAGGEGLRRVPARLVVRKLVRLEGLQPRARAGEEARRA